MKKEELNGLLEKYYNGESTAEDEKLLRAFFSGSNIPEGYEAEKALFGYFMDNADVPETSPDFESRIMKGVDESSHRSRMVVITRLGIAAGILIIIGLWFFFSANRHPADTFNDPELAYAETMKVLVKISEQMNHTQAALEPVTKMNEATEQGLGIIGKRTMLIRENLRSLDYMQKAIDLTKKVENSNK
jgi:hypothetical protein